MTRAGSRRRIGVRRGPMGTGRPGTDRDDARDDRGSRRWERGQRSHDCIAKPLEDLCAVVRHDAPPSPQGKYSDRYIVRNDGSASTYRIAAAQRWLFAPVQILAERMTST